MSQPDARHHSCHATAHVSGVMAIPLVLKYLGADPARVFSEAGVDLSLFDDPESLISLDALGQLVKHAVDTSGCQYFGLLVGQQGGLQSLGLVGLMVRFSPDVGTALRRLGQYIHLYHGGQVTAVLEEKNLAVVSYDFFEPQVQAVDQIDDGALAILCNIMRDLCGRDWRPSVARFAHRAPDNVRPFDRFFRCALQFDAEQSALVFASDWLHHRLPDAGPELQHLLQQQIELLEARHGDDFPEQVRGLLRSGLLTGRASSEDIAALLSIHSRTLTRRLKLCGTSFKAIADEGRYELAQHMLQNTSLDMGRIAAALDYADASAFTRAFHRWSGTTPARWRAQKASH